MCGARSFEGFRDGGLWDSWEAEFYIGLFKELRNDFPCGSLALMPFEKHAFPGLALAYFLKTGHNFLDSIGEVLGHAFDKNLFHVIVEAE